MSFKLRNRDEVRDSVEEQGLEYFITGYCSSDSMPDQELKEAFDKLEGSINEFKELLGLYKP